VAEADRERWDARYRTGDYGPGDPAWLEPFGGEPYCLFARDALSHAFAPWELLVSRHDDVPAPGGALKRFHTLVARRPEAVD